MKTMKLQRSEWIEAVRRQLIAAGEADPAGMDETVRQNYRRWAVALAETYYDAGANEYSPVEAVNEELSNA